MNESDKDVEIDRLKQLLGEAIRQPSWMEEARKAVNGSAGDKKLVNFRLDPEVLRQLKMLAVEKGKPMQALLCDGLNKIFI